MKKSIFIAVLGLATGVACSYGQGFVVFSSYAANAPAGVLTSFFLGGAPIGTAYTATLYYALGTVSDPVNLSSAASITSPVSGAFTLLAGSGTQYDNSGSAVGSQGLGFFDGPVVTIPGYAGGAITFEIVATGPNDVGRSGSFTMNPIGTQGTPVPVIWDNGTLPQNFLVAPVPEPTTMALVGLGSLALVALRRKQS